MNERNTSRRVRTGTLEERRYLNGTTAFFCRLRLADHTRSPQFEAPTGLDEAAAREWLAKEQAAEDADGKVMRAVLEARRAKAAAARSKPASGELVNDWFERYITAKECGEGHRRTSKAQWGKWIAPHLEGIAIADLTRDKLEDIRDALDRAIDGKQLRSAANIWGIVTAAMKAASAAKDRTLRAHPAPIHLGILPPKKGIARTRTWIYPREWQLLAKCSAVPTAARRMYAVALYTGLRPQELRALTWGDLDFDARVLHVSKAIDAETDEEKSTKTETGLRTVPIHTNLLPLLEAMKGSRSALVLPELAGNVRRIAERFRDNHLPAAGVTRHRLFADTETEEPIDFRSLRDSYATWSALADVAPKKIKRRMGHKKEDTTDRYIKAAESFDVEGVGEPFPPLPDSLWPNERSETNLSIENLSSVCGAACERSR